MAAVVVVPARWPGALAGRGIAVGARLPRAPGWLPYRGAMTSTPDATPMPATTTPAARPDLATDLARWRELRAGDAAVNSNRFSRITLAIWRFGNVVHGRPGLLAFALRRVYQVADIAWCHGMMGADLPPHVRPGERLHLAHGGRGIVLHPTVTIGDDCMIFHQVTIGVRAANVAGHLERNVFVGAGAKILGDVTIGDSGQVGANAVVVTDVEPGATYVGIPAKPVRTRPTTDAS